MQATEGRAGERTGKVDENSQRNLTTMTSQSWLVHTTVSSNKQQVCFAKTSLVRLKRTAVSGDTFAPYLVTEVKD